MNSSIPPRPVGMERLPRPAAALGGVVQQQPNLPAMAVGAARLLAHIPQRRFATEAARQHRHVERAQPHTAVAVEVELAGRTADDVAPAYCLVAVTLVSFVFLLGLPETARKPLT